MINYLVPQNISIGLKEKGFKEPCLFMYDKCECFGKDLGGQLEFSGRNYNSNPYCVSVPFYDQVSDWFRREHKIHLEINYMDDLLLYQSKLTTLIDNTEIWESGWKNQYYEAYDKGIIETLKLIQ